MQGKKKTHFWEIKFWKLFTEEFVDSQIWPWSLAVILSVNVAHTPLSSQNICEKKQSENRIWHALRTAMPADCAPQWFHQGNVGTSYFLLGNTATGSALAFFLFFFIKLFITFPLTWFAISLFTDCERKKKKAVSFQLLGSTEALCRKAALCQRLVQR